MSQMQVTPKPHGELPEQIDMFGRKVLIMGLGSFGGGLGATRFCAQQGAKVTVTDLKTADQLQHSLARLQGLKIHYHLGSHDGINFRDYDLVVVNPAVPKNSPWLQRVRQAGVPMTSEMNLFLSRCKGKIVGITGSNGKTTTTALTAHLLQASDRAVWLGGNIGVSLLEQVDRIGDKDAVVLELSSFQLEDLHRLKKSPTVSVITNLSPNHLDRHGNFEAYIAAKMAIFAYQKPRDITILNYDDVRVSQLQGQVPSRLAMYSVTKKIQPGGYVERGMFTVDLGKAPKTVCSVHDLKLPGLFNRSNAIAAILASMVMRTPPEAIGELLRSFKGVEHRLELVGEFDGVKFYNDSVSTTPESTLASLGAIPHDCWLIVGGANKGLLYGEFADAVLKSRAVGIVGVGEIGPQIIAEIDMANRRRGKRVELLSTATIEDALDQIRMKARPGQVVLLSPATASYDQFRNFEERGIHFKTLAKNWRRGAAAVAPRGRRLRPESLRVTNEQAMAAPTGPGASGTDMWSQQPPMTSPAQPHQPHRMPAASAGHHMEGPGTAMWGAAEYAPQAQQPPATPAQWPAPGVQMPEPGQFSMMNPTSDSAEQTERMQSPAASDPWAFGAPMDSPPGFDNMPVGSDDDNPFAETGHPFGESGMQAPGDWATNAFGEAGAETGAPMWAEGTTGDETHVERGGAGEQPWGTDPWIGAIPNPEPSGSDLGTSEFGGGGNWPADGFGSHEPAVANDNWADVEGDAWADSQSSPNMDTYHSQAAHAAGDYGETGTDPNAISYHSDAAGHAQDYNAFGAFDTIADADGAISSDNAAMMSDAAQSYYDPNLVDISDETGLDGGGMWAGAGHEFGHGMPPEDTTQQRMNDLADPDSLFSRNLDLVNPMDSVQIMSSMDFQPQQPQLPPGAPQGIPNYDDDDGVVEENDFVAPGHGGMQMEPETYHEEDLIDPTLPTPDESSGDDDPFPPQGWA